MNCPNLNRGEEYYQTVQMADGSKKIAYYYCSMRGALFSCLAHSLKDAAEQCESWLLRHERH